MNWRDGCKVNLAARSSVLAPPFLLFDLASVAPRPSAPRKERAPPMKRLPPSFSALVLGGAAGAVSLLQGGTAAAGHTHFSGGGGVHVSGGGHFSVGVRAGGGFHGGVSVHVGGRGVFRPWRPWRPGFGGHVWVGGYYYPRPYYY